MTKKDRKELVKIMAAAMSRVVIGDAPNGNAAFEMFAEAGLAAAAEWGFTFDWRPLKHCQELGDERKDTKNRALPSHGAHRRQGS